MAGFFSRLKKGLSRSRETLAQLIPGSSAEKLTDAAWQDIEDALIMADCGVSVADDLVQQARRARVPAREALQKGMLEKLAPATRYEELTKTPLVLLVIGVNGTGKTTTIGKLATMFRQQGKKVIVGAGDTFRAAAVEQLATWVERAGADMVRQHEGADPAAVAFDTVQRGYARGYDVIIIDTAGRVQNDQGLMNELAKVRRVITKAHPDAPHEVWQVVDAGTGQNAIVQVDRFRETAGTTGLIITKLDGTGKGGIVLQLADRYRLPIRYIGVGESLEDLMPFDADGFVQGLLPEQPQEQEDHAKG
jgi:fused signal recognition particle receptor